MFDKDKWQEILSTIRKNKLRTFLTALGVFWGIFMLVFILGMGNGLETGVFRNFGSGAKNIMFVWTYKTSMPYKGLSPGRFIRLNLDDMESIEDNIPGVGNVSPRMYLGDRAITYGEQNASYECRGEYPISKEIEGLILDEGRYLNINDITDKRKVAVIGRTVKKEIFGDETAVGKHIRISGIDFQVVGVFATPDVKEWNLEQMEVVTVPLTTTYAAFGIQDRRVSQFVVASQVGVEVSSIEEKVRAHLKERHKIDPEDKQAIRGFNLEQEFKNVQNLFLGIKFLLWFVGIGTLFAGIIGVSNIMMITVKERTKEIGIRKAMGAAPGSIINMILTESVFITSIAGYLGLIAGTFLIFIVNYLMVEFGVENQNFYDPKVNLTIAVSALLFLIIAGTLAGLIPAMQAAKVNPVIALKDE
ncbi:MAG: ABC transporter permease [Saprospiraceae bacterium]|nr:ABC transporter permease [Saprospiraceae bacterium]